MLHISGYLVGGEVVDRDNKGRQGLFRGRMFSLRFVYRHISRAGNMPDIKMSTILWCSVLVLHNSKEFNGARFIKIDVTPRTLKFFFK